jgi:copper(I)-binding protein
MTRSRSALPRLLSAGLLCLLAACSRQGAPEQTVENPTPPPETAPAPKAVTEACAPKVHDAWVRLVPDASAMDAGYAIIDNPCSTPAVITGATSPSYADVSVHESAMADGMSQMRPVDALRIEPNSQVELKPGSYHLMLMAPRMRPTAGQRVTILFQLQDGRTTGGVFEARPIASPDAAH